LKNETQHTQQSFFHPLDDVRHRLRCSGGESIRSFKVGSNSVSGRDSDLYAPNLESMGEGMRQIIAPSKNKLTYNKRENKGFILKIR
jgi:hypothetical protein